jgi:hypothetical protein
MIPKAVSRPFGGALLGKFGDILQQIVLLF